MELSGAGSRTMARLGAVSRMRAAIAPRGLGVCALVVLGAICMLLQRPNTGFTDNHHGRLSAHGATLAANMSLRNGGFTYERADVGTDGEIEISAYNRFPAPPFLLMRWAMLAGGSRLDLQILFARRLMYIFFFAAVVTAFLIAFELTGSAPVGVSVSLLAFSSWYLNQYNDMIFNDVPALFGLLLAGHGAVVHALHGRKGQLYAKALIGAAMGWQVLAFLFVHTVVRAVWVAARRRSPWAPLRDAAPWASLAAAGLALALLGWNLLHEQRATGKSFGELPTLQSARFRAGMDEKTAARYEEHLAWGNFLRQEAYRIGRMCFPNPYRPESQELRHRFFEIYGVVVLIAAAVGVCLLRHRIVLLPFLLCGFAWSFPMRAFTAFHDFQSMFYVGVPLSLFLAILSPVRRSRVAGGLLTAACIAAFLVSNIERQKAKSAESAWTTRVTSDFQSIARVAEKGKAFHFDRVSYQMVVGHARDFYLSGSYLSGTREAADYVISTDREFGPAPLTPTNTYLFLFHAPAGSPASRPAGSVRDT